MSGVSSDKNLTHLDEEYILSHGFEYGLFDTECLWRKGSDGREWYVRISVWQRKINWYYIEDEPGCPPKTVGVGYLTRKRFKELFG